MEIVVHRGTHQIGGCATEYRTKKARIIIDFGAELDNQNASGLDIEGVTKGKSKCDAIFFTHYHGDHIGLLDTINTDIPLYMGEASKEICRILNNRLTKNHEIKSYDTSRIDKIRIFKQGCPLLIGDMKITPFMVDHSAYDAYMFLIEADGKRILHTGDFRDHGFRGKGLKQTLEAYIGQVNVLVCEGTTLHRDIVQCETEHSLKKRIRNVLLNNKYVFVVCSSTNIDRLAGICSAVPIGKYCVCDEYQKSVIEYISKVAGSKSSLYKFHKMLSYGKNLDKKMLQCGFCMFIRCSNQEHKKIIEKYKHLKPVIIYSMWKGYLKEESVQSFLKGYIRLDMHTSGHADSDAIDLVIKTAKPEIIIPMHTELPEAFEKIWGSHEVLLANDGQIIHIGSK